MSPLIRQHIPTVSKANSYVSQCWTIQMRQAKSYLAFRCEIPKYIIHVILFAKGCISSTHYSCSYRSIISCCKWYRKYAYCYISRQTCRTSPLLLCYAKSTPVFSTAATRCSNIHTWYRNIINCICFTGTSIVTDARNCCKYIWKFEGKSYIWSTCIVSKSPLFNDQ